MDITRVGMRPEEARVNSSRIPCKAHCPKCGNGPLDGCTSVEIAEVGSHKGDIPKPQKDDITLCSKCATWLQFSSDDLDVELAPQDVVAEVMKNNPEAARFYNMLRERIRQED